MVVRKPGMRSTSKAARISDVARSAGVSTATVSRALTYPDRVKAETRDKVLGAVARLGYTPNEAARTLRAGASRMILVIIPERNSPPFFASVLDGFDAVFSAHGYTMIMGSLDGAEEKARRIAELAFARHVDGLVVLTGHAPMIDGRSVLDAGLPVVAVCAELDRGGVSSVVVDDESCATLQTRHLLDLGHTRLMYVAGPEGNYNEIGRYRGFRNAVAAAGLDPRRMVRVAGDYMMSSGVAAGRHFLSLREQPTGIVCASDEMAIGFLNTITRAGVRCPEDVSVVGFDDIEFAAFCAPMLTTIHQPRFELGATGARTLLAALVKKQAPTRTVLPCELVVRESAGPAPTMRERDGGLRVAAR